MSVRHAKPDWSKIRYKKLTFKNFGQFRGKHEIDFRLKPEVVGIFHIEGENGTGKSTVVRALKFLFLGEKAELNLDIKKLVNDHEKLAFDSDAEVDTVVTLTLEVMSSVENDQSGRQSSNDPLEVVILRKLSGNTRNLKVESPVLRIEQDTKDQEYTDDIMKTYFSEGIVRFLFYDGEISNDFKTLLESDSPQNIGRAIKDEIVGILGIDMLRGLHQDLRYVKGKIDKDIEREALYNIQNNSVSDSIARLSAELELHKTQEAEAISELRGYKSKKVELETYFKNHKDSKETLAKIDSLKIGINENKEDADTSLDDFKKVFDKMASRMLVTPWVRPKIDEINEDIRELDNEIRMSVIKKDRFDTMEKMIIAGICDTCESKLSPDKISNFKMNIDKIRSDIQSQEKKSKNLNTLINRREGYAGIIVDEGLDVLREKMKSFDKITLKIDAKKNEINKLEEQMRGINNDEIRVKQAEDDTNEQLIGIANDKRNKAISKKQTTEAEIERLRLKLVSINPSTIEKQKLANFLSSTIESAIELFVSEVRESVEKDANAIFLALTTQKEFKELKLDENYVLSIKLENGSEVPLPSMAQKRTLILALISALHKNSDLNAPLVMDSAFTGFGDEYKEKILQTLHQMSNQVILLTFKSELALQRSKEILGGAIQGQARLKQSEWGNSQIEEV